MINFSTAKKLALLTFGFLIIGLMIQRQFESSSNIMDSLPSAERDLHQASVSGSDTTGAQMIESYGQLPMTFEINRGQTDPRVKYLARGEGYSLFLSSDEATLVLNKFSENPHPYKNGISSTNIDAEVETRNIERDVLRLQLVDANPNPQIAGQDELPGKSNYLISNDPQKWHTNITHYTEVQYQDVYPGIDLLYYGNQGQLEYDFIVSPGADPADIRLHFEGADRITLDDEGDLLLQTAVGQVRQHAPVIYQEIAGVKQVIPGHYTFLDEDQVSFEIGPYDPTKKLIIDPVLVYSTFLGGSGLEGLLGSRIAADSSGNIYLAGYTSSTDFPTVSPTQTTNMGRFDAFLIKLDPTGSSLDFATYLGGSGDDFGLDLALDSAGNIYVTGYTDSTDFPTANPIQPNSAGGADGFLLKLDSTGSTLAYATYLGGSGDDNATSVVIDNNDAASVVGSTRSTDFPTASPIQAANAGDRDSFVLKIDAAGSSLIYSTYLGGSGKDDQAQDHTIDTAGNVYIVGFTDSMDFPTINPLQSTLMGTHDAFVTKINATGSSLSYSTFLGGSSNDDAAWNIAVDASGHAYVVGRTNSDDFPTMNPIQAARAGAFDAYVAKLNPAGSGLVFSTYLGGSFPDQGRGVALDSSGNIYVTGFTSSGHTLSTNFPVVNPIQPRNHGSRDGFIAKLDSAGTSLLFSTYLGGSNDEYILTGIAVDAAQNLYLAGTTNSTDFPITQGAYDTSYNGGDDIFVVKISPFDLHVAKSVSASTAKPDDILTYQVGLSATNGAITATLTDTLPAGLTYVNNSATGGATFSNGQILYSGLITAGTSVTLTYQAKVDTTVQPGSILYNEAVVVAGNQLYEASKGVAVEDPGFTGTVVLIYTSGDNANDDFIPGNNDLSEYMLELINKAERSADNPDVVTLLLLDGPGRDNNGNSNSYLYRLQHDQLMGCPNYNNPFCQNPGDGSSLYTLDQNVWQWGENVGSPYSLFEFTSGAIRAYPNADKILLSLVGHGGGWSPELLGGQPSSRGGQPSSRGGQPSSRGGQPEDALRQIMGGMLWDNTPADSLSTADLAAALRWTKQATGKEIDLLYLDACLMAMSEVAYEVRNGANYLLASQSWSWTSFSYDAHLRVLDDTSLTPEEIGRAWLANEAGVLSEPDGYPFTYSLIDLKQMDNLFTAQNAFAQVLSDTVSTDATAKAKVDNAFKNTACFDSNQDGAISHDDVLGWEDNYCDLDSFAREVGLQFSGGNVATEAQAVRSELALTVKMETHQAGIPWLYSDQRWDWGNDDNLGGLSVFLPLITDTWKRRYYSDLHLESAKDGLWDEFLAAYWNSPLPTLPDPTCPPQGCTLPPAPLPVASIAATAQAGLDEISVAWVLQGTAADLAGYHLYRQEDGGSYALITTGLSANDTQYQDTDTALNKGSQYCYQIKGVDSSGNVTGNLISNITCTRLGELALSLPQQAAAPNDIDVLVPITLDNGDGLCIGAMDITVSYASNVVQANGNVLPTAFTTGYSFAANTGTPGQIKIAAIAPQCQPLFGGGTLFQLGFDIAGSDGQVSSLDFIQGITGTVVYDDNDLTTPLPLKLKNGSLSVSSQYMRGDINGDGGVNAADALLALRVANKKLTPTTRQRNACDILGDNYCDSGDSILILCHAAFQDWGTCAAGSGTVAGQLLKATTAQTNVIKLAIKQTTGQPNQPVSLPVAIANAPEFAGGSFAFVYDPDKITASGITLTSLTNGFLIDSYVVEPGLLRVSLASNTPINADGDIFQLEFDIITQSSPVSFADFRLYDAAGRDLVRSALQRTIQIVPYQDISDNKIHLPIILK